MRYTGHKMKTVMPKRAQKPRTKKSPKKTRLAGYFRWFETLPSWLKKFLRTRFFRFVVGLLVAVWIFNWVGGALDAIFFPPVSNPTYGVSFSPKRARELGIDPHANLDALLQDMGLRNFRLMSYWDEYEKDRGKFDFSELDWEMNEVAKYGGHVSLGIGLRQPRWPECHEPNWAYELKGNAWKQALYAFMEVVAKRYENHPALISWQLENEAYNGWFGSCDAADDQRIHEEFSLLKSWSSKPIWMSMSDQHGFPVGQPTADAFGFSVYRWVYNEKIPPIKNNYVIYPTPIWYHRMRSAIIQLYTGRPIFIHELQLEPWGPTDTKDLSLSEQDKTMSLQQIHDNIYFARQIGEKDIYLWGSEWWYWRKVNGDSQVWDQVKHEINTQR